MHANWRRRVRACHSAIADALVAIDIMGTLNLALVRRTRVDVPATVCVVMYVQLDHVVELRGLHQTAGRHRLLHDHDVHSVYHSVIH